MVISSLAGLIESKPLQSLVQYTGTILSVSSSITHAFRRVETPHLFALGEILQSVLPNDRILTITAQIISIAHNLLTIGQSLQEVQFSWHKLTSARLIPSTQAILCTSAMQNIPLFQATVQMCADRLLQFEQYFYEMTWHLLTTALEIYDLARTVFWSEEAARTSRGDIFLHLQECGRLLFDTKAGDCRELLQTLASSMTKTLTSFGLKDRASSLFAVTKTGLEYIEKIYQHLPTTNALQQASRDGYHLTLQTVIGIP